MDIRTISEEYTEIAEAVIQEYPCFEDIRSSGVSIVYLTSEHKKMAGGCPVYAQCEKVPDKYKWGIPCDFTITVFSGAVDKFTQEQKKILMYHELLHVGINSGEAGESYFARPHDLEDFKQIIDKFGVDWDKIDE